MGSSVLMVLTMNDPARFAWYTIPLDRGGGSSRLRRSPAFTGVRDLPLPLVGFFLAGCSSALVARGVAYSGRFSTILIGAGSAITVCAVARLVEAWRVKSRSVGDEWGQVKKITLRDDSGQVAETSGVTMWANEGC